MPPKSDLWQYFRKAEDNKNIAICRFCSKKIKTCGNTSNLKCHIQAVHIEILKKRIMIPHKENQKDNESEHAYAMPSTSKGPMENVQVDTDTVSIQDQEDESSDTFSECSVRKRQKTMLESFSYIKSHKEGGRKYSKITNSILFMICRDYQPINIVENEGFIQLMRTTCPQYKLPSRKTISKLIDDKYKAIRYVFQEKIKSASNYNLTCDIWTETMKSKSFLGITLHFLEENDILDSTLGIYELDERHTSEYIAEKLTNICDEWQITHDKISSIVTDGAANMIKAVDISFGKQKHIICFAHILNLVVTRALEQVEGLTVKNIVRWFKQSVVASDLLRKNSLFFMLERFLKLRVHVNTIVNIEITAPPMLTAREVQELQVVVNLLQPFESATCEISGSKYTTGSIIIPLVYNLKLCLNKVSVENFALATDLKLKLTTEVEKRLAPSDQITMLAVGTILDPRFKKIYFNNPVHCARAIEFIQNSMKESRDDPLNAGDEEEDAKSKQERSSDKFTLWGAHKRLVAEKMEALENRQSKIALYLKNPLEPLDTNPIEWWRRYSSVYQSLVPIALKYLSILATSVPAERLFSKAGETITQRRNSLLGKRISQLLFLQSIDQKYWDLDL